MRPGVTGSGAQMSQWCEPLFSSEVVTSPVMGLQRSESLTAFQFCGVPFCEYETSSTNKANPDAGGASFASNTTRLVSIAVTTGRHPIQKINKLNQANKAKNPIHGCNRKVFMPLTWGHQAALSRTFCGRQFWVDP